MTSTCLCGKFHSTYAERDACLSRPIDVMAVLNSMFHIKPVVTGEDYGDVTESQK